MRSRHIDAAIDAEAEARLFCFPYAGGSEAMFRTWHAKLPLEIDVVPVHLPGRLNRAELPRAETLTELAERIAAEAAPLTHPRYALFGYSFGAYVAFEVARALRRRGEARPSVFIAAAMIPPGRYGPDLRPHRAEATFEWLLHNRRIPDEAARNPDLLQHLQTAALADGQLLASYEYEPDNPLECPILLLAGCDDWHDVLLEWEAETVGPFDVRRFPGGHFFIEEDEEGVLAVVARAVLAAR